jgi:hypothetical protein
LFGLPLTADQLATFQKHTGRNAPAPSGYLDVTLVIGRRGGKSLVLALIAAFLAVFHDWSPYLTSGERGTIIIVSADKKESAVTLGYLREMLSVFDNGPDDPMVTRDTDELLGLRNGIMVEIVTPNFRTIRGRTVITPSLTASAKPSPARRTNSERCDDEGYLVLHRLRPGQQDRAAVDPVRRHGIVRGVDLHALAGVS